MLSEIELVELARELADIASTTADTETESRLTDMLHGLLKQIGVPPGEPRRGFANVLDAERAEGPANA